MRVLDLFSGIGGFSLGLERAGMRTVAFCECEPYARAVLRKHWPDVPCYDDVRTLTADRLDRDGIGVDLICGGFPCQDISYAGEGRGLAGERSGLWAHYARLIREVGPRYVIVENVAALLTRGLGDVLGELAEIGYDTEWHCIPAAAVGAPHRRDRIWIIAYPRGEQYKGRSPAISGALAEELSGADSDSETVFGAEVVGSESDGDSAGATALADTNGERKLQPRGALVEIGGRAGDGGQEVADASSARLQGAGDECCQAGNAPPRQSLFRREDIGRQWSVEPDVGGSLDGLPVWLDRHIGKGMSHAESHRSFKALCEVWTSHVSASLWRAARGLERVPAAEVLFAFVRQLQGGSREARQLVAGEEACEALLRSLRREAVAACTSRQPSAVGQPTGESADALQVVSQLPACDGETPWPFSGWEDGLPRVAAGVSKRVDRLRCLGNAVVPQIPEIIGRAIMNFERRDAGGR